MLHKFLPALCCVLSSVAGAAAASPPPEPAPDYIAPLARWLQVDALSWGVRYQGVSNSAGEIQASHIQHQPEARVRLKLDREDRYSIRAWALPGGYYTGGWNNTGLGTGDLRVQPYLRGLYFSAEPVDGIAFELGGLDIERGAGTDVAGYAFPAFATGYRARVSRPASLFFDKIAVTSAHVGEDLASEINVFDRFHRMDELNYHQALVEKGFGEGGTVSFDYTSRWGRQTLRQAVWMRVYGSRWVDRVSIEAYQRLDEQADFGYHFALGRNLGDILHVTAGVADIDPNYGLINTDAFWYGRRVYFNTALRLGPGADFFVLLHHGFANSGEVPLHRGVQAGLRYDLKTLF